MLTAAINFITSQACFENDDPVVTPRTFLLGGIAACLTIIALQRNSRKAKPVPPAEILAEKTDIIWQQLEEIKAACRSYQPRASSVNPYLSTIAPNDLMQTADEHWTKKHHSLASKVFTQANFEKHKEAIRVEVSNWLDENMQYLIPEQLLDCVGLILAKYFICGDDPKLQPAFGSHIFHNYNLRDRSGSYRLDICRNIAIELANIETPAEGTFLWHMCKANYSRETKIGVCLSLLIPATVLTDAIKCALDNALPYFFDKNLATLKEDINKANLEAIRLQNASKQFSRFHRNPEIVGEDPNMYFPDRYSSGAPFLNNWRNAPFVPFGHGPYACVAIGFCQFLSNLFLEEYLAKLRASNS